ncbi:MAG TPA: MarR family transcriptional regulator, partial [Streptosporangiaceae bacterium]
TGRGREITEAGLEIVDRVHQDVLDALPPSQRDAFLAAMTTLVDGYLAEPVDCDRPVRRPRQT